MNSRRVLNTKIARCKTDRKKITVFGVMLLNGSDVAMMSEGSKAVDLIRFLEVLRAENPSRIIILILDNARIHHAKVTMAVCEKLDIRLVHLPPYSPDLNPIESLWKDGKKKLGMLEFTDICENVETTLNNMMEERKMGYSRRWLEKFNIVLRED
jgi:transposase